jgi:hypothetical protein
VSAVPLRGLASVQQLARKYVGTDGVRFHQQIVVKEAGRELYEGGSTKSDEGCHRSSCLNLDSSGTTNVPPRSFKCACPSKKPAMVRICQFIPKNFLLNARFKTRLQWEGPLWWFFEP